MYAAAWFGMKKGGMLESPGGRLKYCGEPKIGAGGKPVMKLDMVAPAGPSVVMYAIGCFKRAALDITRRAPASDCLHCTS